eukprot:GSChrysophyteH1.ASY1.ANO1.1223.1 assembled CDS
MYIICTYVYMCVHRESFFYKKRLSGRGCVCTPPCTDFIFRFQPRFQQWISLEFQWSTPIKSSHYPAPHWLDVNIFLAWCSSVGVLPCIRWYLPNRYMSYKSEKYETTTEADGIGDLSTRLQNDLKKCVARIGAFQPLSQEWQNMALDMHRIGNITKMEVKLPKESKDATLWDCDELALRFLLEHGKLNLVLRNLVRYKQLQRELRRQGKTVKADLISHCLKFEQGSGITLKHAWLHIEALQTTDIPLLVEHIVNCLSEADLSSNTVPDDTQLWLCPHYVLAICKGMEDMGEDQIMPLFKRFRLVPCLIRFLLEFGAQMSMPTKLASCEALSLIFDSDDYTTFEDQYLSDANSDNLVALGSTIVQDVLDSDCDIAPRLRPLLDEISNRK